MDRRTEHASLVALLQSRWQGWSDLADDVERCGSAYDVLMAGRSGEQAELFSDGPGPTERLQAAGETLAGWEAEGLGFVTLLDDDYPAQLLTVHQRPPFLFYRGTLTPDDANGVAVVGTRHPSTAGVDTASEIAAGLADRGISVISGLAAGIDTAAHRAVLAAHGRTAAVIGTGIRATYPAENRSLQEELARSQLVLSQFWPDAGPSKASFPMRNSVMSGYAAVTVVVEATGRSGARMQARLALQQGRPVFLFKGLLEHDWAREYASQPGTHVVTGPDEVVGELTQLLEPAPQLVWT